MAHDATDPGRSNSPLDLEPIKARLRSAGYEHPRLAPATPLVRDPTRVGQDARAALREHILGDVWALIDEVERLRRCARDQWPSRD
jgi:hypothetical protein